MNPETFLTEFNKKKYPPKKYKRNLSPQFIESARQRIQLIKPWAKSTGPRTAEGKAISSKNALKHGMRSQSMLQVERTISLCLKNAK